MVGFCIGCTVAFVEGNRGKTKMLAQLTSTLPKGFHLSSNWTTFDIDAQTFFTFGVRPQLVYFDLLHIEVTR